MRIEIDQSGKIEETQRDTVLAFANGKTYSIRIEAKTKRKLQQIFRSIGEPKIFVITVYTIGLYLLIRDWIRTIDHITIDNEYPGFELIIEKLLKKLLTGERSTEPPIIVIDSVGDWSNAHKTANKTYKKKLAANQIISFERLSHHCFRYKNGYPALKYRIHKDQ